MTKTTNKWTAACIGALGGMAALALPLAASALIAGPPCETSDDCAPCDVCSEGICLPTPGAPPVCQSDTDCPEGDICLAEPYCQAECVPAGIECTADEHCGACAVCVAGECKGTGLSMCQADEDCNEGETCFVHPTNACKNECRGAGDPIQCTEDEDCGPCGVCDNGGCVSLGGDACTDDIDCGEGEMCVPGLCGMVCAAAPEPCSEDTDCPACNTCTDGECTLAATLQCLTDADCGEGETCAMGLEGSCASTCEPSEEPGEGGEEPGEGGEEGPGEGGEEGPGEGGEAPGEGGEEGPGEGGEEGPGEGGEAPGEGGEGGEPPATSSGGGCSATNSPSSLFLSLGALFGLAVLNRRRFGRSQR